MAWLEAHQELRDHPKTKRAARMLGISRPQMIGHLLCLWWWCMDYAEDGDLSDFDSADIADAADWEGDPETFIDALVKCGPADRSGFLVCGDGTVTVNDWQDYGGKYVTKRAQGRERQRNYRERNATVTRYGGVTNAAREDKRREDKKDEGLARPPAAVPVSEPAPDPEHGAALSKLEALGMITGNVLLEFDALWPDLGNGRRAWVDDAVTVARANGARSPAYAVRVLANAVKTGRRPGQAPDQPARSAKPQGRDLKKLLGITEEDERYGSPFASQTPA
jgi:hypothetical protein